MITSEHTQTRELVLRGNAQVTEEIRAAAGRSGGVLNALAFPAMKNRLERVNKAHAKTFEWIFKETPVENDTWKDTRPPFLQPKNFTSSSFKQWLMDENDKIYWINVKAGSGKSTLMKFIYGHLFLRTALKRWAGALPLIVVGHFFWNSGESLQISEGSLESTSSWSA